MAQAVVDIFEAVQVHEQHCEQVILAAAGVLDGVVQAVNEQGAVGQPGQRVIQGVVHQALLHLLALGDIGLRAGHAVNVALCIPNGNAAAVHPTQRPIFVVHAVLALEVVRQALDVRRDVHFELPEIITVNALEPFRHRIAQLAILIAEHGLPARRVIDAVGAHIPIPQPIVGAANRQGVALFAFAQRGLDALTLVQLLAGLLVKVGVF